MNVNPYSSLSATLSAVLFIAAWLGFLHGCASSRHSDGATASEQDYALFVCALRSWSTGPCYVLINVVDARSGSERGVAISANALRSAIHHEYGIPYTDQGRIEIDQKAKSAHDLRFTFHDERAIKVVTPAYTPEILARVRSRLDSLTDDEIVKGLILPNDWTSDTPTLHDIYTKSENENAYRDAFAHVLLERHLLCSVGDIVAMLGIDPCPKARLNK